MFVKTAWRLQRMFDVAGALREMNIPADRSSDVLGLSGVDFSAMTQGHFDHVPGNPHSHRSAGK